MKLKFIIFLTTLLSINAMGQTTEFSIHLTSGLFSFRGENSNSSTFYNIGDVNKLTGYTNSPWGRKSGFSYGFAFNVQRVTKSKFIFGLQTAYESLTSKVNIQSTFDPSLEIASNSKTDFNHQFFNLYPFIGKRFKLIKNLKTDLTLGLDIGICLKAREHPNIKTDQGTFSSYYERSKPEENDYRIRFDIINYYKNLGFTIGYSHGLTNYMKGWVGGSPEVFSRMIRVGLVYKIKF